MKATGIVRKVDELGRIVIPKELRDNLDIALKDPIEIFVEDDFVMLKKYQPSCIFCGEGRNLEDYNGKKICPACISKIKEF